MFKEKTDVNRLTLNKKMCSIFISISVPNGFSSDITTRMFFISSGGKFEVYFQKYLVTCLN